MNAHQVNCLHEFLTYTGEIPCTGPKICQKCKLPEKKIHAELMELIERAIDRYGLKYVIDAVGSICSEKSEHIETQWQDRVTAEPWRKAGLKLADLGESKLVKEVS